MSGIESGSGFRGTSNELDRFFEQESFTKVKQSVIAAGGKGTRISPEFNPNGSKVLIEHNRRTLFEHLVDSLVDGGIERLIVSTAYHTDRKIREIMGRKNIESVVIPISEMGSFRWIPYYMQDLLDDRFMFVCGHQPLNPAFVREMLESSTKGRFVASAYEGGLFAKDRGNMKINYNPDIDQLQVSDLSSEDDRPDTRLLIDSPYILSKDIVLEFTDNNGQGEYNSYILNRTQIGESLKVVKSSSPPEFDYDEEFARTIGSLK